MNDNEKVPNAGEIHAKAQLVSWSIKAAKI